MSARLAVDRVDGTLVVRLGDRELPPLWLRERCSAPSQVDPVSGQRLFDPHLLAPSLSINAASVDGDELVVAFSDGHEDRLAVSDLVEMAAGSDVVPRGEQWVAGFTPPVHEWEAVSRDDRAWCSALGDFLRSGAIIIAGAPIAEGTVGDVASRFGYVRETNFGRIFDVRSVPQAIDLAYTALALSPHTDNPYRAPVPGIQLLHCLVNEASGGLSTMVDSLAVTARLQQEDPEGFDVLATTPVQFRFHDPSTDLRSVRTVIERDLSGAVVGLNYSPRVDHPPLMSAAATRTYQRARRRLAELLRDPAFEIRFMLEPGEVEMFANDRVLHGRTGYDPTSGARHLQGCYIDADAPRSHYRVLANYLVTMNMIGDHR